MATSNMPFLIICCKCNSPPNLLLYPRDDQINLHDTKFLDLATRTQCRRPLPRNFLCYKYGRFLMVITDSHTIAVIIIAVVLITITVLIVVLIIIAAVL